MCEHEFRSNKFNSCIKHAAEKAHEQGTGNERGISALSAGIVQVQLEVGMEVFVV